MQQGSIPLTLLVVIVVGGVVAILFGVVQSGIRSSARDRDFGQAIHVADAGVQEAYSLFREVLEATADDENAWDGILNCRQPDGFVVDNTQESGACAGELGSEASFDWTYECVGRRCEVLSVGRYRSSVRAVQISVTESVESTSTFDARREFEWSGGGSGGSTQPLTIGVGTSVDLPTSGSSRCAIQRILFYGPPAEMETAIANSKPSLSWYESHCNRELLWQVAEMPDAADPVPAEVCNSSNALDVGDVGYPTEASGLVGGTTYCLRTLRVPNKGSLEVVGDGDVTVYVLGPGIVGTDTEAVWVGNNGGSLNSLGSPDRLEILVSTGLVRTRSNSEVSARITAPFSDCRLWPGNNGFFRGSAFCNRVDIQGVYNVVDASDLMMRVRPTIELWTEEPVPSGRR